MKRRTVLQSVAALFTLPIARLRAIAQLPSQSPAQTSAASTPASPATQTAPADLTDANIAALNAVAEVVLPAALGARGRNKAVADFVGWVRNYKEGADRGHSYGASTVSAPTPVSPAARYPPQFAALDKAAEAQGASTLAALPTDKRRVVIEAALNQPQPVTRLPARPTGTNLVADFMGLFFNSADGFDLAYNAAIGRDSCRGLEGSDQAPEPYVARTEPGSVGKSEMEAGSSDPA